MKTIALITGLAVGGSAMAGVTLFEADINEAQANAGDGTGSPTVGTLTGEYNSVDNTFTFSYELTDNLIGAPAAPGAHLHNAPAGSNGPIVFGFSFDEWQLASTETWTDLTTENVDELFAGNVYINFHTTQFPGGEVRGQITVVPAPAGLAAIGLGGLVAARRRR